MRVTNDVIERTNSEVNHDVTRKCRKYEQANPPCYCCKELKKHNSNNRPKEERARIVERKTLCKDIEKVFVVDGDNNPHNACAHSEEHNDSHARHEFLK